MTVLAFLHARLALALILFAIILGIWGSLQLLRRKAVSGGFRSSFLMMAALTAVQGLLGAAAFLAGGRPHELLHVVYGIFAVIFLPGVYVYVARGSRLREAAFMAGSCWIVAIAFGRGILTGGP